MPPILFHPLLNDTTLYLCATDIPIITLELQVSTSKLFRWFRNNHLKANPGKTPILLSTKKLEIVSIDEILHTFCSTWQIMLTTIVLWLKNRSVKIIYYWNWYKTEQIKNILELGSSNTENYSNNNFYSYLQNNDLAYTCFINHTTSIRHQKVRLTCKELPTSYTACRN